MKEYTTELSKTEKPYPTCGLAEPPTDDVRSSLGERSSLPCLFSNISTENPIKSTSHRKAANALSWNVSHFAERFGLENIGFLTLTFAKHITDHKTGQKHLNSLLSHVIVPRYKDYIGVVERQKSGRLHYHLLVNIGRDIRTGVYFHELEERNYTNVPNSLRKEWAFWRKTAPKYGFGRTELLPIKSTSEAIGRYVGKYIGKHMEVRHDSDKNARLVRYSRSARIASTRFMFLTEGSAEWRAKVSAFAYYVSTKTGCEPTFKGLRSELGAHWAHHHRSVIASMPVIS